MLEGLWDVGSYIVAISILVAFHEFGHFWVARRFGVKVLRYSIGFGKPIWKRTAKDGVDYQIGSIPLGGYVKLLDEREGEVAIADLPRAFNRQPVWARIAVYAAGPVFNFILAIAFYWLLFVAGIPGIKSVVAEPTAGSAAARAGLHEGDQILSLDGDPTPTWAQLRTDLLDRALAHGSVVTQVRSREGVERQVTLDLSEVRVDPEKLFDDVGLQTYEPPIPPVLGDILPDSAASHSGLKAGDRIESVDGVAVDSFQSMRLAVSARAGKTVTIGYSRNGQSATTQVTLGTETSSGKPLGQLGARSMPVSPDNKLWQDLRAEMRLTPLAAVPAALAQTWQVSGLTLKLLHRMLIGEVSVKNVSGPIQIAQAAGFTASHGWVSFLGFMALVSVSLGIFNLLPVPILDGGQILYALIEAVKGSPLSERMQVMGQQMGLVMLALLMGLAIFNDISRSFG
jgi:regulator of sigma E protease